MTNWLEFLYAAQASPHGVCVSVDDVDKAKQALYRARRESGDISLSALAIRTSPFDPFELWIVKDAQKIKTSS